MSANPCLLNSSRSAVTFSGRFNADKSISLVLALPYLELLAEGVAANRLGVGVSIFRPVKCIVRTVIEWPV